LAAKPPVWICKDPKANIDDSFAVIVYRLLYKTDGQSNGKGQISTPHLQNRLILINFDET